MAKWGEGDPRWIVEERPDATNVNNWHWTEKNASDWSKEKLKSLFKNLFSKCDGEATANNRKGKLIFFYEWSIEIEWKAEPEDDDDGDTDISGQITIVNLSEENEPHEIEIDVSLKKSSSLGDKFKEFIRIKGLKEIREKVKIYIQALKDEYASDLILPTKGQPQATTCQSKTIISQDLANNVKNIQVSAPAPKSDSNPVKFNTSTISLSQNFKCTADELYKAITIKEMVCAFTRNDVKWNPEKGGKFELFGGNVSGEFVELVPNEKIVQKWRFKSWPSGHFSVVVLTLNQGDDSTRLDLQQTGVPVSDIERTKQGWQNYYWDAIKRTFGFGALLT
ncbi:Activator of 90 kDa heat shock protein ATPase-like protein 1 [Armadillidium vulgare]|nr:Activator of 90 kDa heat shock protein ATPase-like protein 1 [Armadillidium vulgare]